MVVVCGVRDDHVLCMWCSWQELSASSTIELGMTAVQGPGPVMGKETR